MSWWDFDLLIFQDKTLSVSNFLFKFQKVFIIIFLITNILFGHLFNKQFYLTSTLHQVLFTPWEYKDTALNMKDWVLTSEMCVLKERDNNHNK